MCSFETALPWLPPCKPAPCTWEAKATRCDCWGRKVDSPHPPTADPLCGKLPSPAVFDGHGGRLAADYLEKNLYNVFNDILKEDTISLTCSVKGVRVQMIVRA